MLTVNSSFVVSLASAGRYWNAHWNWPATARTLRFGEDEMASTLFSVWREITNMKSTIAVGIRVQVISARLLPWVWGGSSSSPGFRR